MVAGQRWRAPGQRWHPVKDGTQSKTFTLAQSVETQPSAVLDPMWYKKCINASAGAGHGVRRVTHRHPCTTGSRGGYSLYVGTRRLPNYCLPKNRSCQTHAPHKRKGPSPDYLQISHHLCYFWDPCHTNFIS